MERPFARTGAAIAAPSTPSSAILPKYGSVTLPYLVRIADQGLEEAASENPALAKGLSTLVGNLLSEPVAEAHELSYTDPQKLLR